MDINIFLGTMKQTKGCKCGKTIIPFDNMRAVMEDETVCEHCNEKLEYIGLQPFNKVVMKNQVDEELRKAIEESAENKPAATKNEQPKKEKEVNSFVSTIDTSNLNINNLIDTSGRVSNKQMIPAMKDAIDADAVEALALLQSTYPDIFEGSKKYMSKKHSEKLQKML